MKQVIDNITPTGCIGANEASPEKVYGAVIRKKGGGGYCILRFENWSKYSNEHGWIFRYIDSDCGVCGWRSILSDALLDAMEYADIYEFRNYKEAFDYFNKRNAQSKTNVGTNG
jgi:hypothetical protein